jgi:hypothetical protein
MAKPPLAELTIWMEARSMAPPPDVVKQSKESTESKHSGLAPQQLATAVSPVRTHRPCG